MSVNLNKESKGKIDINSAKSLNVSGSTNITGSLNVVGNITLNGSSVSGGGGAVTGSTDFFAINRLDSQGVLLNSSGNLILSSAIGSVIAASGALDFPNTDKNYHIRAVNSPLILSSSNAGTYSIYVSGTIATQGAMYPGTSVFLGGVVGWNGGSYLNGQTNGQLKISTTNQATGSILDFNMQGTTGPGGIMTLKNNANNAAYLSFGVVNNMTGTIAALSSSLILSSSATSAIYVSGILTTNSLINAGGAILAAGYVSTPSTSGFTVTGRMWLTSPSTNIFQFSNTTGANATGSCLDFSPSSPGPGGIMTLKNNANTAAYLSFGVVNNMTGTIAALSSSLILSSSNDSVIAMSGAMRLHQIASTALPAGTDNLSGAVYWVTDYKCGVIYGPEGWTRILTGAL